MSNKNFIPLGVLLATTLLSGGVLSSSNSFADDLAPLQATNHADATVTVAAACNMEGSGMNSHSVAATGGNYYTDIGTTDLKVVCNDSNGFDVYAIGFSGDTEGNTDMVGTDTSLTIPTGVATGDVSNWSMKLTKDVSSNSYQPANLTITTGYDDYHAVPSTYTKVAHYTSATDAGESAKGSRFSTTYAVRVSTSQAADTYTGKVKYVLVHPSAQDSSNAPTINSQGN